MNSAAELETVLAALLSADNGTRNQAEAAIRGYVRTPASIEPMMVMVGTSVHASVRQMAAVFLRKRLCSHWAQLPPTAHPTIKAQLLTLLAGETYRPVRRAIAAVVAVLAKMLLKVEDSDVSQAPDGRIIISGATVMATWPELLQYLGQASAAPDASHRETAMLLFFYLGETCALRLRDHFETLIRIFDATLRDAESIAVRVMSLKAVGRLIEYLADEEHQVLQFRPLFPAMLQVLSQCVAADDLQTTILMLDVFSSLVDAPAPFVDPTIPELIMIVTTIQGLPAATKPLRDASLLILNSLARSKPKALVRNGKIAEIVRLVLMSLALPWDASEEEDPEYDDAQRDGVAGPPTHRIAQSVFDRIAIHLPSVQVIEAMVPICSEAMRAAEPHVRAMAPLALGIAAEGCEAILSKHVGEMLPSVVNLFRDADNGVRHCACFCVGQWIEHMEDVLTKHHAAIIPQAFMLLDAVSPPNAPVPDVQRGALYVLECFSERLPAEILAPYLDHLMTTIVGLLANTDGAVSAAIKSMALCVASTAAINAEQLFLPYFQRMAPGIKSLMSISDPTQFLLRAKAMQAMGQMAVAVGSDNFVADHLAETMHRAQEGLQFQDVVLDENTFIYFANMAQVTGAAFGPQVASLVPALLDVACSEDGLQTQQLAGLAPAAPAFGGADDEDDQDDLDGNRTRLSVREAELDKKVAAIRCVGAMAKFCSASFVSFLPQCVTAFEGLMQYPHEAMRLVVMESLVTCSECCNTCFPQASPWVKGLGATQPAPLRPEALQIVAKLVTEAVRSVMRDPSKKVVAAACELMQHVCETWGPQALAPQIRHVLGTVLLLLREKTPCQDTEHDYGEEEDPAEAVFMDHDNILVDAVADLIGVLARTCGESFGSLFLPLAEPLFSFCEPRRAQNDRAMALGAFAEVIDEVDSETTAKLAAPLLPVLLNCMETGNYNMRRNAVYCTGVLAAHAPAQVGPHLPHLLNGLRPHLARREGENWAIVDNTASALCRIVMSAPNAVPVDQILPLVLQAVPLQDDPSENMPVYTMLFALIDQSVPVAVAHFPEIVVRFARALTSPDEFLEADIKAEIAKRAIVMVEALRTESGGARWAQVVPQLAPPEAAMLHRIGARIN